MTPNNPRKRQAQSPDNISKKKPKIDQIVGSSAPESGVLEELTPRIDDLGELPEEDVSSSDYDTEDSEDSDSSHSDLLAELEHTNPEIHKKLNEIQQELEKTEPNVMILLKAPLRIEDRAKLCQLYEIYKSLEPNTMEWLEARTRYNGVMRDYFLAFKQYQTYSTQEHERMKGIEEELSNYSPQLSLKYKILNLNASKVNKAAIYRRFEELQLLEVGTEEYSKLKHWLTWAVNIPHDNMKKVVVKNVTEFLIRAADKLDRELFGMDKVKEQILLFLNAKLTNPGTRCNNLALVGPPGVGKTAIARLIAEVMNWGFEQISFGGVNKADFLKGHEYTYVGAQPGAVVKCLRRMGHKNGIIFLDELEKTAENPEIRSALLHLVDRSQKL